VGRSDHVVVFAMFSARVSVGEVGVGRIPRELSDLPTQSISFGLGSFRALMPASLDIQPLSADKVSDADTDVSSPQAKSGNPIQSTLSTQIQISTIILMPALPHPTSPPSTSSPKPISRDIHDLRREYTLGTSCIPYTPDD